MPPKDNEAVRNAKRDAPPGGDTFVEGKEALALSVPQEWLPNVTLLHTLETLLPSHVMQEIPLSIRDEVAHAFNTIRNQADKAQTESGQLRSRLVNLSVDQGESLGALADVVACEEAVKALPYYTMKRVIKLGEPVLLDRIREELKGGTRTMDPRMFQGVADAPTQDPSLTREEMRARMPLVKINLEGLVTEGVRIDTPTMHIEGDTLRIDVNVCTQGAHIFLDYPAMQAAVLRELPSCAKTKINIIRQ